MQEFQEVENVIAQTGSYITYQEYMSFDGIGTRELQSILDVANFNAAHDADNEK